MNTVSIYNPHLNQLRRSDADFQMIMIGSGAIETQPLLAATTLPQSQVIVSSSSGSNSSDSASAVKTGSNAAAVTPSSKSGAMRASTSSWSSGLGALAVVGLAVSLL